MSNHQSHQVIALISGGKDSLFSLLHCLANGHDVIALANLHPTTSGDSDQDAQERSPGSEEEDLESYMYQTVGHSVIPLYARALDRPLYRQAIRGRAVDTRASYAAPATASETGDPAPDVDETESLTTLLARVKAAHPTASAVSAGAILSTYQRTRVESVALRLGLVPLAFLWQYPVLSRPSIPAPPSAYPSSAQLLADMAAVGMDARIVKVASGGLDDSFLWANVTDAGTVSRLASRMSRFGALENGAVLGEGGEFETLAVDGPTGVWKAKVEVVRDGVVNGEGGSASVRIVGGKAIAKTGEDEEDWKKKLRLPSWLDPEFERVLSSADHAPFCSKSSGSYNSLPLKPTIPMLSWAISQTGSLLAISNMIDISTTPSDSFTQLDTILTRLKLSLASQYSVTPTAIVFSTLLLRSIASFATVNAVYTRFFPEPNPPARVTVACGDALPDGVHVMLSVLVDLSASQERARHSLHVQSRSYWAPANIGPYSQATAVSIYARESALFGSHEKSSDQRRAELVFMAGQIPLDPASMELVNKKMIQQHRNPGSEVPATFKVQAVLALQHLWRVGRAMDVMWWAGGLAFLAACEAEETEQRVTTTLKIWDDIHWHLRQQGIDQENEEDDDDVDMWDLRNGVARGQQVADEKIDARPRLPKFANVKEGREETPPCFVVQVDELPRSADIEWTGLGLVGCQVSSNYLTKCQTHKVPIITLHHTSAEATELSIIQAGIAEPEDVWGLDEALIHVRNNSGAPNDNVKGQYTVYTAKNLPLKWLEHVSAQVIPCRYIWNQDGMEIAAAVVIRQTLSED